MYAKVQITGKLNVMTGMHIGGSGAFSAIGAVDSPVIRDARTNLPMIPGSSLKGKMRALLAKEFNPAPVQPDDDIQKLTRLFGTARKGHVTPSRILVSDMVMSNAEELRRVGLQSMTEVKFENGINRLTAVANPRQIERVVRGAQFPLDMIYEVSDEDELVEDMETLAEGLRLLQYDYLGGSGSRGYGKVAFDDLKVRVAVGQVSEDKVQECSRLLQNAVVLSAAV